MIQAIIRNVRYQEGIKIYWGINNDVRYPFDPYITGAMQPDERLIEGADYLIDIEDSPREVLLGCLLPKNKPEIYLEKSN